MRLKPERDCGEHILSRMDTVKSAAFLLLTSVGQQSTSA